MNKKSQNDIVLLVIISAAIVTVVRYVSAFIASDTGEISGKLSEIITIMMGLTGMGMGLLDVFGGAYLFNGWRKSFPRTGQKWSPRFRVLTFFVFGLIASGMVILVPFTVSRISHESLIDVLGVGYGRWIWSGMVNIIPYFLMGGVFFGNKIIADMDEETSTKRSEKSQKAPEEDAKVSENFPKDWRRLRPLLKHEQVVGIAQLSPSEVRALASRYNVTERTVQNWRASARQELNMN